MWGTISATSSLTMVPCPISVGKAKKSSGREPFPANTISTRPDLYGDTDTAASNQQRRDIQGVVCHYAQLIKKRISSFGMNGLNSFFPP